MTRAHPTLSLRAPRVRPAMPDSVEPMLAVAGELPANPEQWAFEYKWDGVRCLSYWDGRRLRMSSRNGIEISQRYPELMALGRSLGKQSVILDGEIITLDTDGRPSFPRLQKRMHVDHPSAPLVKTVPAWYVVFDVLYANRRSTMELPYLDRREILDGLKVAGSNWQTSPYHIGDGAGMLAVAKKNAMEGVVAKLLYGVYEPGRRSPTWRKIKSISGQEFVVGGWIPEAGDRHGRVGALLLGYYETTKGGKPALRYAGRVGTGFSDATHELVISALKRAKATSNPFIDPLPRGEVVFVKPILVAEVEYRRWPDGGLVQQAAFKGLRTDKSAREVVKEA